MTPLQVLAACGLLSGVIGTIGGFTSNLFLVGLGSLIMLIGNTYAVLPNIVHKNHS